MENCRGRSRHMGFSLDRTREFTGESLRQTPGAKIGKEADMFTIEIAAMGGKAKKARQDD